MSGQETLSIKKRNDFGTGAARSCRNAGMVPGVLYGANKAPEGIAIDPKVLSKELHRPGFFSRLFHLDIEGQKEQVIVKDVQLHAVTDNPLHVDFMRVTKGTKIHVHLPLHFINEDKAPALKRGGILNIVHHSLEIVASPDAVPESLNIDLSAMDISKGIHLTDIKLPAGVVAAHAERDNTLATVVMPKADKEASTEEAE
ncbi:MAG: 50S ribosomal protein L25/general stress protein Ctc [Alphaproteobacteria bacterium]|nr:50S ribosomal protein L25/general stress protein Ctc [Alphaproteobacteria bacterium]